MNDTHFLFNLYNFYAVNDAPLQPRKETGKLLIEDIGSNEQFQN